MNITTNPQNTFNVFTNEPDTTIIKLGIQSSLAGGTTDHRSLTNRDANNQHPIGAITDLQTELNSKQDAISDLATIRSGAEAGSTALQAVPETYRTAAAQDVIDEGQQRQIMALKNLLDGVAYSTKEDTTAAYSKTVPTGAQAVSIQQLSGQSVMLNQLVENGDFTSTTGWATAVSRGTLTAANNELTYRIDVKGEDINQNRIQRSGIDTVAGHIYYVQADIKADFPTTGAVGLSKDAASNFAAVGTQWTRWERLVTPQSSNTGICVAVDCRSASVGQNWYAKNVMVIDLTQMFGAGNEPSTVAEFHAMFPEDYYDYNDGEIVSAEVTEIESRKQDSTVLGTITIPAALLTFLADKGYGWSAGSVYNEVDFENKKYIQRVGSVVLNGSQTVYSNFLNGLGTERVVTFVVNNAKSVPSSSVGNLTSLYDLVSANWQYTHSGSFAAPNDSQSGIKITISGVTDLDAVKSHLEQNPLEVYYELAEPIEYDISTYLPDDENFNFLLTEPGGSLTFKQAEDTQLSVPQDLTWAIKKDKPSKQPYYNETKLNETPGDISLKMEAVKTSSKSCVMTAYFTFSSFSTASLNMLDENNVERTQILINSINDAITISAIKQDGTYETYEQALNITVENELYIIASLSIKKGLTVEICSNGYTQELNQISIKPQNAALISPSVTGSGMFNKAELTFSIPAVSSSLWAFGDSYFSNSTNRWMYYLLEKNEKLYVDAYPGEKSIAALASLKTSLTIGTPKTIVWCLGMNNGDPSTSAYNGSWKECLDEVIEICDKNGIKLILATIPNTPTILNVAKNAYVKSLGYQFIDFAKAVEAETEYSTWKTGMLSSDNVHPTIAGAKELFYQAILDCPQLIPQSDCSGGTSDFNDLSNRPKYNGATMTGSTNIPEVKTATWDGKLDKSAQATQTAFMTNSVGVDNNGKLWSVDTADFTSDIAAFGSAVYPGMEQGSLSGGTEVSSTTRVRSYDYLPAGIDRIRCNDGFQISAVTYKADGTWVGNFGDGSTSFVQEIDLNVVKDSYNIVYRQNLSYRFRIMARKTDTSAAITPEEITITAFGKQTADFMDDKEARGFYYEAGWLHETTGQPMNWSEAQTAWGDRASYRCRTARYQPVNKGTIITADDGTSVYVFEYDSNGKDYGECLTHSAWTNRYKVQYDCHIRIMVKDETQTLNAIDQDGREVHTNVATLGQKVHVYTLPGVLWTSLYEHAYPRWEQGSLSHISSSESASATSIRTEGMWVKAGGVITPKSGYQMRVHELLTNGGSNHMEPNYTYPTLEQGGLSNGAETTDDTRVRSDDYIPSWITTLSCNNGYEMSAVTYNAANNTWVGNFGNIDTQLNSFAQEVNLNEAIEYFNKPALGGVRNYKFRILVRKKNATTTPITPDEITITYGGYPKYIGSSTNENQIEILNNGTGNKDITPYAQLEDAYIVPFTLQPYVVKNDCILRIHVQKTDKTNISPDEYESAVSTYLLTPKKYTDVGEGFFNYVYKTPHVELYNGPSSPIDDLYATTPADIYGLYDGLAEDFSSYITKIDLGDITGTDIFNDNIYTYDLFAYRFKPPMVKSSGYAEIGMIERRLPKIMITSGIHGSEKPAVFALYNLMYNITHNWQSDGLLRALRWNVELIVVPVCNPWGFEHKTRWNGNGVNLNRNFQARHRPSEEIGGFSIEDYKKYYKTHPSLSYYGPSHGSELETQALQKLIRQECPDFMTDLHTLGNNISFDTMMATTARDDMRDNIVGSKLGINVMKNTTLSGVMNHGIDTNGKFFGDIQYTAGIATVSQYAREHGTFTITSEVAYRVWSPGAGAIQRVNTELTENLMKIDEEMIAHTVYYLAELGGVSADSSDSGGESGTWGSITGTLADQTDLQAALDGKADRPTIATELPGSDHTLAVNTQYYLTEKSSVNVTLPQTAQIGDLITVVFYSGTTPTILSIGGAGAVLGNVPTPTANQRIELNMLWDGTYWALVSNAIEVAT